MKTKAKKFSHKLLALFMAIVMGITCFSGVMTSYAAASIDKSATMEYHDEDLEFNQLAWRVVSDEQTATAILDYLDDYLLPVVVDPLVVGLVGGLNVDVTVATLKWNANTRSLVINAGLAGINNLNIKLKLRSINELVETIESINAALRSLEGYLPTLKYAYLTAPTALAAANSAGGYRVRENNTSTEILSAVLGMLRQLSFNSGNGLTSNAAQNDIIGEILRGDFVLAGGFLVNLITGIAKIDVDLYNMLQPLLGTPDGYKSNFVYNIVKTLIVDKFLAPSGEFSESEINTFKSNNGKIDSMLIAALNRLLLQKINVQVTYDQAYGTGDFDEDGNENTTVDCSERRKAEIDALMAGGMSYADACGQLGYDANLRYSTEITYNEDGTVKDDFTNNILLFVYGNEKLEITAEDSLMSFAFRALKLAWKTVLGDTVDLLHVNNDVERGHGGNFDNQFYYWTQTQPNFEWNYSNVSANYSETNLNNWAADKFEEYGASTPAEFLEWVENTLTYDRTSLETSDGTWEDIDATTLFGKLRYSPLADYGFGIETGPINLYFLQTGTSALDAFFTDANMDRYGSMVAGFNDCLLAAVEDIFMDESPNVIGSLPELTHINTTNPSTIATTITENALDVIEFTADAIDANILKAFKAKNPGVAQYSLLTEQNVEEAMLPLLTAIIGEIQLTKEPLKNLVHPDDWNACKDVEGIAYIALQEYLSYVLPQNDYTVLAPKDANGKFQATLTGTILPMARDALGYILEPIVPLYDINGNVWKAENSQVTDTDTTIFTLLNSVLCYYANDYAMADPSKGVANGVAALLGICSNNGESALVDNTDPLPTGYTERLWYNIDTVAKQLLPVIGELQYGTSGAVLSSYDLIWNDIVCGVLDIGETSLHSSGLGGVSNFIYRFMTICTSPAIAQTHIVNVAYNLLRDLINGVFGVRYSNQKFGEVVPVNTSANPFDAVLQKNVVAGTNAKENPGLVQKLIIRLAEAGGFGGYGENRLHYFSDSIFKGIAFALNAVVGFVPTLFPTLGDSGLYNAESEMIPNAIVGITEDTDLTTQVRFTNNITGLNTAHLEGNTVVRDDRYTVKITEARYYDAEIPEAYTTIDDWSGLVLEPGQSVFYTIDDGTLYYKGEGDQVWITEIKYDIVKLNGDPIVVPYENLDDTRYTNLKTTSIQFMSDDISWAKDIYPNGEQIGPVYWDHDGYSKTTAARNTVKSPSGLLNGNFIFHYPEYIVIPLSDPNVATNYALTIENQNGSDKGMDGVYSYDNKTVHDEVTNSNVSVTSANAKITTNANGDAVDVTLYDYSTDGGATWNRNEKENYVATISGGNKKYYYYHLGWTAEQIADLANQNKGNPGFITRPHVAYTLQELIDNQMFRALTKDANGNYDAVYIKSSSKSVSSGVNSKTPFAYDSTLAQVTAVGPFPGTYIRSGKVTVTKKSDYYYKFLGITSAAQYEPGEYPLNLTGYAGGKQNPFTITFVVADDSNKPALQNEYNSFMKVVSQYSDRDFTDYNASTQESAAFLAAKQAAADALKALSTPLKTSNVTTVNDDYAAGTEALKAAKEALLAMIDQSTAQMFINDVSEYREPLNQNNFNIISYNMMTKAARKIENAYNVVFNYTVTNEDGTIVTTDENGDLLEKKLSYSEFKGWRDNDQDAYDIVPGSIYVETSLSNVQVVEYTMRFYQNLALLYERGYLGNPLEAEIECAAGAAYDQFDVTEAVWDEDWNLVTPAVVRSNAVANPDFGAYVDGVLVNEGPVKYPTTLWNNYVNAIAKAVTIAQIGNGDYAHKTQAIFDQNATDYDAQVTACYSADSELQVAEIALEKTYNVDVAEATGGSADILWGPVWTDADGVEHDDRETISGGQVIAIPWRDYVTVAPVADAGYSLESLSVNDEAVVVEEDGTYALRVNAPKTVVATFTGEATPEGITISGTVTIANSLTGGDSNTALRSDEIEIKANGEVIGHTNADGTFTVTVPAGVTSITFSGGSAIPRTLTLTGASGNAGNVAIAICDYNGDTKVDGVDLASVLVPFSGGAYNVFCDYNADNLVDGTDLAFFLILFNNTVAYDALSF